MKAHEWIDRVKAHCGWESDYRAAKELCITRSTVSGYRSGKATLDEDVAIKVAEALGIKPGVVMFDQMRERAKSPKVQAVLEDAIKQIGRAAAILFAVFGILGSAMSPAPAHAGAINYEARVIQIV